MAKKKLVMGLKTPKGGVIGMIKPKVMPGITKTKSSKKMNMGWL